MTKTNLYVKILSVSGICFLLYLLLNFFYLRATSLNEIKSSLKNSAERIQSDLVSSNNKWDTTAYVNDSQIPINNPLYIFTSDGFVVDRSNQIGGFLDTANYKYNSSFLEPKTIVTPANETWRIFSRPIKNGVILVGYFQPEESAIKEIDKLLISTANSLNETNIDERKVSLKVSFEIVDNYNHLVTSIGGLPSYIDKSYLVDLQSEQYKTITDKNTKEQFLVYARPLLDNNKTTAGFLVVGNSLKQRNSDLNNQFVFSVISGVVVGIVLLLAMTFLLRKTLFQIVQKTISLGQRGGNFGFDKETGVLYLYDKKMEIPPKTNQYYICKLIFSNPKKEWESDEIAEKAFGSESFDESETNKRKIYDAVRLLNKKGQEIFGGELILINEGYYRVNPNIKPQNQPQN